MSGVDVCMNIFVSFLIGTFVAIPIAMMGGLVSFFGFEQTFLMSSIYGLAGGGISYFLISGGFKSRFLKKNQLSRKEYKYILKNLDEAKLKIKRLNRSAFQIREIPSIKQRFDVVMVTRKIYNLTKKEPKRFYKAEQFYFSHLDSVVELTEKYALLSSSPKKSFEMEQSLNETRNTLNKLAKEVEKDLYEMLSDDIDDMNFEVDVAKKSIKTLDDSRRLKK
jgi:5-bromo-4-chloroindolyl phosphate hydrolysis protein